MKKLILFAAVMALSLTACGKKSVEWNGNTEIMENALMISDISNLYEYAGIVDYIFVGTVNEIEQIVIPENAKQHEDHYSKYRIRVDKNLKGELVESIVCSKMGGLKKDGTMMLLAAELPDGTTIVDSDLPPLMQNNRL